MRRSLAFLVVGFVLVAACGSNGTSVGAGSNGTTTPTAGSGGSLGETTWVLASYQGPVRDVVPAVAGASAPLSFAADGTWTGSTGCNRFGGSYVVDGDALSITIEGSTVMGCPEPAIQAQETAVTALLPQVAGFDMAGDDLALTDADGVTLLTYAPGLASLEGTSWKANGVNNGTGGVTSSVLTENLTAVFGADGAFSGSGGCNGLGGTYATSGSHGLTINASSTEKACAADIMTLEEQYLTALGKVTTYLIAGDQLMLKDADGANQVTLTLVS